MRQDRLIGVYSIALGLSVLGLWAVILSAGGLPEGRGELGFHLASEAIMALGCLVSGLLLLRKGPRGNAVTAAAHAMVIYSTLNAAGYYLERGEMMVSLAMSGLAGISALIAVAMLRRA